jgi:hypothetical protein
MDTDKKIKRKDAENAEKKSLWLFTASAPLRFAPSVFISVHPWLILLATPVCPTESNHHRAGRAGFCH